MLSGTSASQVGILAVGLMAGADILAATAAPNIQLAPHRAIYDMKLGDAEESSGISALSGRMVYEFSGSACEGYSVSFRFVTRFVDQAGSAQVTDLRTSSYEQGDSSAYQFLSKTFVDQNLIEATKGVAESKGNAIAIELTEPAEKNLDIDRDVYFPTEHMAAVLQRAKDGNTVFIADVFDGADTGDKVYSTTTFIGPQKHGGPLEPGEDAAAVERIGIGSYWPVTISYFDETESTGGEETPVYALNFFLYENGISRRLILDYGDFKIAGTLTDLEMFPQDECLN